jgi:predicted lipoprotein with Yx(FWY)xxD motif
MPRTRHLVGSLIAPATVALAVAGCGGGSRVATASSATPASAHGTLAVATKRGVGSVLVDARGRTLYRFAADGKGRSTCAGSCAQIWPPATAPRSGPVTAAEVKGTVGTTTRADGRRQLTFNGMPLYRFAQDTSTADAKGQGVERFFVIPAKGGAAATTPSAPSTTSSKPKGGYGY